MATTVGTEGNETTAAFSVGQGSWDITHYSQVSPDILLVYLTKMAAFYRQVGETNNTAPISREVKDRLIT